METQNSDKQLKKKKRNPLDDMLDQLEEYEEGCENRDLLSSGE